MTIIFTRISIWNNFGKCVVFPNINGFDIEIQENHTFSKIITNRDSGKNNSHKIYLIEPTPHKSTIAHPMVTSDLDTDGAFIVLLVISRLGK